MVKEYKEIRYDTLFNTWFLPPFNLEKYEKGDFTSMDNSLSGLLNTIAKEGWQYKEKINDTLILISREIKG